MPTLSADTQAVLATDKVRFQGQEVAFVVADDRYSARDALELIDVEYEPLPVVVDARARAGARRAGDPRRRAGRIDNHIFDWEAGDAAATDGRVRARRRASSSRRWSSRARIPRRWRPAARSPTSTASTASSRSGARRRRRTRTARCTRSITGLPEHKHPRDLARRRRRLRQQGPGLSRLRLRDGRVDACSAGRSSGSRTGPRT